MAYDAFDIPLTGRLAAVVADFAADEAVRAVAAPSAFPTTRGDYGRYMSVLSRLAADAPFSPEDEKLNLRLWGIVLARAGGDRQGLYDALVILGAAEKLL